MRNKLVMNFRDEVWISRLGGSGWMEGEMHEEVVCVELVLVLVLLCDMFILFLSRKEMRWLSYYVFDR